FYEGQKMIRSFSNHPIKDEGELDEPELGTNLFVWDMKYPKADEFDGMLMWWGTLQGPKSPPGEYSAELFLNGKRYGSGHKFKILMDPRSEGTEKDLQMKFDFLLDIRNTLDETHDAITDMRLIKSQISKMKSLIPDGENQNVVDKGNELDSILTGIEKKLYQTKLKSNQDMLNYPIMLNNKLAHVASLASMSNDRPTEQMMGVRDDLTEKINLQLQKWKDIKNVDLPTYNDLIRSSKINVIGLPEE
ncbi:MAG: hypothetical protein ACI857_002208, partial [Arenicella sp.]